MASISGTSSLGNTALRGFGGLGSGIDRDSIIEQMTLGTKTKISNKKLAINSMQWKQEAYQSVSGKILDLTDNYFSYASGKNLKDASVFARNRVTALGDSDVTKFIKASGSSSMMDHLSVLGVKRLAKAAARQSREMANDSDSIDTNITENLNDTVNTVSNLKGTKLEFGTYQTDGSFKKAGTFTFPTTYKEDTNNDGEMETHNIKYDADPDELARQLNLALKSSDFKVGDEGRISFGYKPGSGADDPGSITITGTDGAENYVLNGTTSASALKALGFDSTALSEDELKDGINLTEFNDHTSNSKASYLTHQNMIDYLKEKELTITYGGQTKSVKLLKESDLAKIGVVDGKYQLDDLKDVIQDNLNRAFGTDKIEMEETVNEDGVKCLAFKADSQTLTINSNDPLLLQNLGLEKNSSNKVSLDSSIAANIDKLFGKDDDNDPTVAAAKAAFLNSLETDGLVINGVKIEGVTKDTTINEMIRKINTNKEAGVKATYLTGENKFVLTAAETGTGRVIEVEGASEMLFGDGVYGGNSVDGQDAEMEVSYGGGITTTLTSSTNTFNVDGLKISVTGLFGYKDTGVKDPDTGEPIYEKDSSQAVTFSAEADAEGVTETVKKFIEEYNALIKEINEQVTTKPNESYGPLTEEQKAEMDETSIENWEKKAKSGLLFNDSTMRDLSMDMQSIMSEMLGSGISYEDLEKIGITMSDDNKDGGTLTFDENKFKEAMGSDSELVSDIFTGGGDVTKGFTQIVQDKFSNYATRYSSSNSRGRLIEEAGSDKMPSTLTGNQIYRELLTMEEDLVTLQRRLSTEQDRYISQFTTMERLISQMNSQSSYLSSLSS